ncbi:mycothione reductase [Corynebacterium sp. CCUG 51687]|uniref:mycothione reductase n=1 Tax=Corynebacterium sp. CCUG 51687 TaxID=2823897 RepID=UPI002109B92B|nr:mycothione reductase [Corynebacterium sp. CCUG 51687]MCQ4611083.1 mycothione reductase [Corynebacterium sp. CCUG 51687]
MSIHVDEHFDLIIIGTGSGNSILTPDFDDKKVAIVEEGTFGGTCLNVGCIPTKMYVLAADAAYQARTSKKLGVDLEYRGVDWPSIVDRVFTERIDKIAEGGEAYRRGDECPNVTVFDKHATFVGPKTLSTGIGDEARTISADEIVIAAGSRPFIPEWARNVPFHTNEDIMRLPELPKSLTIVGGGFIAMEFAHVFDALGTKVTVVNRSPFLRALDKDITQRFNELAQKRFDVHFGTVRDAQHNEDGVTLTLDDGTTITSEHLLIGMGRIPNGDQMSLEASGIDMEDDGRVAVDSYGRTSCPGVWALGDVSSPYQLKHVANAEMRAVRHNLLAAMNGAPESEYRVMPHEHVPFAVFTEPQIATVGLTEEEATSAGYDITVKQQNYGDVAYGWALEDTSGIVKLVADRKTGKLLGAHLIGPQASTLIQQLITIMAFHMDLREVVRQQYWIHPALPEVIENAILGLDLVFIGD